MGSRKNTKCFAIFVIKGLGEMHRKFKADCIYSSKNHGNCRYPRIEMACNKER